MIEATNRIPELMESCYTTKGYHLYALISGALIIILLILLIIMWFLYRSKRCNFAATGESSESLL